MGLLSIPTYATGDTIEASWANTLRDNDTVLDLRTAGDPGAANRAIVSITATQAGWQALAEPGQLTDAKVSKGGDTILGTLLFNNTIGLHWKDTAGVSKQILRLSSDEVTYLGHPSHALNIVAASALFNGQPLWHTGNDAPLAKLAGAAFTGAVSIANQVIVLNNGASGALLYLHKPGATSSATFQPTATGLDVYDNAIGGPALYIPFAPGSPLLHFGATMWDAGNDGAGSGLDADLLDNRQSGHGNGEIPISDGTVNTNLNADMVDGLHEATFLRRDASRTILNGVTWTIGTGAVDQNLTFVGRVNVAGDWAVTGMKSRIALGIDGERYLLQALETPEPRFEDVGRSTLQGDALTVPIPPDFANVIDTDDYHVFVQPEGPAALWVTDRTPTQFTVRKLVGDDDIPFSWRLIARQGDMAHVERLAQYTPPPPPPPPPAPGEMP